MAPVVELSGLTKAFGDFVAVDAVRTPSANPAHRLRSPDVGLVVVARRC